MLDSWYSAIRFESLTLPTLNILLISIARHLILADHKAFSIWAAKSFQSSQRVCFLVSTLSVHGNMKLWTGISSFQFMAGNMVPRLLLNNITTFPLISSQSHSLGLHSGFGKVMAHHYELLSFSCLEMSPGDLPNLCKSANECYETLYQSLSLTEVCRPWPCQVTRSQSIQHHLLKVTNLCIQFLFFQWLIIPPWEKYS